MTPDPEFAEALEAMRLGDIQRARSLAAGLVVRRSDDPLAAHLLGLVECRAGRPSEGVSHLRRASDLAPENVAFRTMLVRALIDAGEPEQAFALTRRPAEDAPSRVAEWHVRAEAAERCRDFAAAAEAWTEVATLQPGDWQAWNGAGNARAMASDWAGAADALSRAHKLKPDDPTLERNLASALAQSGENQRAARVMLTILRRDPGDGAARMLLAKTLSEMGDHQGAMDQQGLAIDHAIAGSADGNALLELARLGGPDAPLERENVRMVAAMLERSGRVDLLRGFIGASVGQGFTHADLANSVAAVALRDGDPERAKDLLLKRGRSDDPGRWHRMMAKVEDSLGNYRAAFGHSVAMNEACEDRDDWIARAQAFRGKITAMEEDLPSSAAVEPLSPSDRRTPAFIVGFPRSGTTLLDTFFMGHPDTHVLEEVHMLSAAEAAVGGILGLGTRTKAQIERGRDAYFAVMDAHVPAGFTGLVVDKMPLNMLYLPLIRALFPDARIVFAQRHPADAVLSCVMQSFVMNEAMASYLTLEGAADLYDKAMSLFMAARTATALKVHTVVYERLVDDPQTELRPAIEFLGLDWDGNLLDHRKTAARRGTIITPSYDQVVKPLSKAPSGRWKRYEASLAPVLPALLRWSGKLGYSVGENSQ